MKHPPSPACASYLVGAQACITIQIFTVCVRLNDTLHPVITKRQQAKVSDGFTYCVVAHSVFPYPIDMGSR